ncbi:MAG TPA: hypothetical protein VM689_20940 [Aliidongia sp.]|nr:hypothetical protein [Aliidongia sp.]
MARNPAVSDLPDEYDKFLFANIGEQKNGAPLSIVTAFARLELDPWDEAARLAKMPAASAAAALGLIITNMSDFAGAAEIPKLSAQLIELLPKRNLEIAQAANALAVSSRRLKPDWEQAFRVAGRINPRWSWGILLTVVALIAWRLF